jgi:hypothetical protein
MLHEQVAPPWARGWVGVVVVAGMVVLGMRVQGGVHDRPLHRQPTQVGLGAIGGPATLTRGGEHPGSGVRGPAHSGVGGHGVHTSIGPEGTDTGRPGIGVLHSPGNLSSTSFLQPCGCRWVVVSTSSSDGPSSTDGPSPTDGPSSTDDAARARHRVIVVPVRSWGRDHEEQPGGGWDGSGGEGHGDPPPTATSAFSTPRTATTRDREIREVPNPTGVRRRSGPGARRRRRHRCGAASPRRRRARPGHRGGPRRPHVTPRRPPAPRPRARCRRR